ncbi:hypothetical protein [Leptothermofonsia sp. ETS-13]|uniref:hypothetical protein n=1 Tax=Leptothermofonsia sp. ETS-13 TaxID=3035696 RepID=UPI003BA19424
MTTDDRLINSKLDILIDQIGRLTEGLTEIKLLIQQQAETAKQQADSIKQQADSIKQQAETARLQAESVNKLVALLEQRSLSP